MSVEYKTLSQFYNGIICDDAYSSWLDFLAKTLKSKNPEPFGIDFACGTGLFTRKVKALGYSVVGVDISPDMLAVAEETTRNEKLNIKYFVGDFKNFKLKEKQGFITAVNDGFNYVPITGLKKAIKNCYDSLKNNGVLMFDVSTPYKLKEVLAKNMFGDDGEELSYIWLSEFISDSSRLDITISFFKKEGEVYKRFTEQQSQYAHEKEDIENILKTVGFTNFTVTDENGNPLTKTSQKMLFIATK
ncbi:MAG: class I SAM-dependent methyltransferase [Clostridia bacterium]|nr:class I SAM-dependent methyltransferase [Clostridia bacterium]